MPRLNRDVNYNGNADAIDVPLAINAVVALG
jgi:hypothetical protein